MSYLSHTLKDGAAWFGMHAGSVQRRRDVEAYQLLITSLFSSPTSILLSNAIAALVTYYCWYLTNRAEFLALAAAAVILVALRAWTIARFYRWSGESATWNDLRRWDIEFTVGSTMFAALVGATCFIALGFTDDVSSHIITIVLGISFSAGYVARNAARPKFVIVQLVCFCVPMIAGLLVSGKSNYPEIAAFIGLYIVTNVSVVFSLNRNLLALAAANKEAKNLAGALQKHNIVLDTAINSMTFGLAMFDAEGRLEVCNTQFKENSCLPTSMIVKGVKFDYLVDLDNDGLLSREASNSLRDLFGSSLEQKTTGSVEVQDHDGRIFSIMIEPTPDRGLLMLTEDVTQKKATAAKIEYLAAYDGLTGLANRFTFNTALARVCGANGGKGLEPAAVLYIDIDNFKHVNDTLGHEAGDELLRQAADRLRANAPPHALLARFGGDEFVILLAQPGSADAVGGAICAAFAEPFNVEGRSIYATTSIGVALWPDHGRVAKEVVSAADIALYAAKSAGRNRVCHFKAGMAEEIERRRELEADLRAVRHGDGLELHYQPLVDLKTKAVVGYEALMRWQHASKGMISPGDFIPLAEQTGLINEMGEWALMRACRDAAGWPGEATVAVNVSAVQFREKGRLLSAVRRALKNSKLPGRRLELEVTESVLIGDPEATLDAMRKLRRLGVKVSLDDFGTGYSSLAYVASYPFSKVKIDRSFASKVTSDQSSRAVIEAVCQLGRRLALQVVVEGVETEEQAKALVELGAEQGQGYHFGRPQPLALLRMNKRSAA